MKRKEFENWLKQQTQETCVKIATRAALRVFPIATHINQPNDNQIQHAFLTARAILTAGVAGTMPTPDVRFAADAAATNAATIPDGARIAGSARVAYAAARTAYVDDANALAAHAVAHATQAASDTDAARAATHADTIIEPNDLFQTPIWHEPGEPVWLVSALIPFSNLLESGPEWSFWREWYQGFLDGKPLDWELQKEIALISDEDWKKGPEWIAGRIAGIRARFELQERIVELESELARATPSRHGIGGNNPPDGIEGAPHIAKELTVIWEPLQDLADQTRASKPNKSKIQKTIEALHAALTAGLKWFASKVDRAIDKTIDWGIPYGGYLVLNPDKLEAVIEAAKIWLTLIF